MKSTSFCFIFFPIVSIFLCVLGSSIYNIRVDQVVQFCRDLKDALARFSPCQELLLQLLLLLLVDCVVLHGEDAFPGEKLSKGNLIKKISPSAVLLHRLKMFGEVFHILRMRINIFILDLWSICLLKEHNIYVVPLVIFLLKKPPFDLNLVYRFV